MKPYSIFLPPFSITSGGIRVMWGLYGWLLAKGQIVIPNATMDKQFVAIYPEIVNGNPMQGTTVVRYLLNKPGCMASYGVPGPTTFDPSDKLYYFSRLFGETDENHYLFLPICNLNLFKDQGKKRNKRAVFGGKGRIGTYHPGNCIEINKELAQDQQVLADVLNKCEVLYCYDPVSALTEISRLCGCRVVVIPSTYSKEEFSRYEPGMNGISWGIEEENKLDVTAFRQHYTDMVKLFSNKLDLFIEDTQS